MGISSIFRKKGSKSSSESSSNDSERRSLDSSRARSSVPPSPTIAGARHDSPVVDTNHRSPHPATGSAGASPPSSPQRAIDFDPPHHAPPPPPVKAATTFKDAPSLPIPEFKAFSISSPASGSKDVPQTDAAAVTKALPPPPFSATSDERPFPLDISHPPKSIPAPPTSNLVSTPNTITNGPVNPSYVSHTETVWSPYTPTQHLAYHTSLFPAVTSSTVAATAQIAPSFVPHTQQRLDLAQKIQRDHQPKKVALSREGEALFEKAGLEVKDREGKGTIDWTVSWGKPVVHEHVIPHEHRTYKTIINREIHRYHVFPVIQPILSPSSTDPADELHYFRDANGQWHEIRGRSLAQEILRASGAETTDEKISWVDDRAVKAEEKELEFLVAGTEGRKGASVVDSGRAVTTAAPYKGMVGDERERDGRAKVVEGVAF